MVDFINFQQVSCRGKVKLQFIGRQGRQPIRYVPRQKPDHRWVSLGNVTLSQIAVCRIDRRTLAPRVYEGGGAQRRGEYAAECYEFASVFGELETLYRMGSPPPFASPPS